MFEVDTEQPTVGYRSGLGTMEEKNGRASSAADL